MSRTLLVVLLTFCAVLPAQAERLWLVIGASDVSPAGIAQKSKAIVQLSTNGLIVQTSDCGDKKKVFAWVAEAANTAKAAQLGLSRLRETVKDAYIKRCDVLPRSLLAFRVSAVDASISDVPQSAVNWADEDRLSSIQALAEGCAIIIIRHYVNEKEDPLEGRRELVALVNTTGKRLMLEENCISPGTAVVQQDRIAFDCAREQAGNHLLHSVVAFSRAGKKLAEIKQCRKPRWSDVRTIVCDAEVVGPDGQLKLHPIQTQLSEM